MQVENVADLLLEGVDVPTRMTLKNVANVTLRRSRAPAIQVSGAHSRNIRVVDTEGTLTTDSEVTKGAVARR
jgi:hypothetical protein